MKGQKRKQGTQVQPRDRAILRELLDARVMTIKHVADLHFGGSFEAAKKRLQKLEVAGFIAKRPRKVQDPAIYSLARAGYLNLKDDTMLEPLLELGWEKMGKRIDVSELMLRHELAVMDVKAALAPAIAKANGLQMEEFTVCPERHAFRLTQPLVEAQRLVGFRSVLAKPDGFLHVREDAPHKVTTDQFFFLEVDRGTESLRRLLKKAQNYSQHYRKGGFALKNGFKRSDFRLSPFRVLMVFLTAERRNNVAELLLRLKTPVKTMIWLTTMSELVADPLGAIWMRPLDYQVAIQGSAFDPETRSRRGPYRRRIAQESAVEAKAIKQALFSGGHAGDSARGSTPRSSTGIFRPPR